MKATVLLSQGRCCIPPQNLTCKQQSFIHTPFSPSCPAVRDWISKSKYFFSLQSSPREPDPDLLWEERSKHQAEGRGPLGGQPNGRERRVVSGGNPVSCPWKQRRGESLGGSPRGRGNPPRKLKPNLAVAGQALWRRAPWKRHSRAPAVITRSIPRRARGKH